jgi:hypothetical protein
MTSSQIELSEVQLPRCGVRRTGQGQRRSFRSLHGDIHLAGDCLRQFGLKQKDISQVALVALGPDVPVRRGVKKLRVHPDPSAIAQHRSFYDGVHIELACDFG